MKITKRILATIILALALSLIMGRAQQTNWIPTATMTSSYTNQAVIGGPDDRGNITIITRVVTQRNSTYLAVSLESISMSTNVIPSVVQPRPNPSPVTNATPGVATNRPVSRVPGTNAAAYPPLETPKIVDFSHNVRHGPPTNSPAFKRMQEREAMRTNTVPKAPANAVIK